MELWLVSSRLQLGVHLLVCCDHALVLAIFHRNHKNRIEFIHICYKDVVFFVVRLYRESAGQVAEDGVIVAVA